MDTETIALISTVIVPAVVTIAVQWLKSKDTNKHGDAFISMLKGAEDSMDKVGDVLPQVKPAVAGYKSTVAEAERIWNSAGFTAQDITTIQAQTVFWKAQIDAAVAAYRKLQVPATP
jgi:hypothetical protein